MSLPEPTLTLPVLRWIIGAVGTAVFFYFVPLIRVVPLEMARQQSTAAAFNAVTFVDYFWNGSLLESSQSTVDVEELLTALRQNPADAATRYGHRLGLSNNVSYFVSGQGHVVAVENDSVSITIDEGGPAVIVIDIGPLFGNAIRDGSGLFDISDFSNTRDFNAVSSEINRRVEEQVLPSLREKAVIGAAVRFVGGVEIVDMDEAPSSLKLVPLVFEVL